MSESPDLEPAPPSTNAEFSAIRITSPPSQKIGFIKMIAQTTSLDLAAAKAVAERQTPYILVACDTASAQQLAEIIPATGAECEVVPYEDTMSPAIANDVELNLTKLGKSGCAAPALLLTLVGSGTFVALLTMLAY
jgi:hypothetical protein